MAKWERRVRSRFGFLADLDEDEQRWAAYDPRHRGEIERRWPKAALPDPSARMSDGGRDEESGLEP